MTALLHVWNLDGSSLCDGEKTDDVGSLRPPPEPDPDARMCAGCVIAVEIYISAVKGTILASRPPSISASEAIAQLSTTRWATYADLDSLRLEVSDGRTMHVYDQNWTA
ncbi:hypothetical protein [Rhodococcus sp. IEGM 1330]|uniref:hypothetical protein n=1 Tax=Rhodococcus sp. IEGM 1330 TaxID=3082225 RepID=UPI002952AAFC|nr:hypothetical protein [Rhodococcus sp. IEGM 1330]MDV8024964.1 hypothetical protein [Rhodococcus sp. IEGM 1330]